MPKFLKYSASAVALLTGLAAAHAQERQQGRDENTQIQREESGTQEKGREVRQNREDNKQRDERVQRDGDRKERMSQSKDDDRGDRTRQSKDDNRGDRDDSTRQSRDDDRADRKDKRANDSADRRDRGSEKRAEGDKDRKKHHRAEITQKKRTVIRERVVRHAPKRYKRDEVNFNISIGTHIPSSFVVYDVPSAFIEIVPEYRGYDYVVVGDVLLVIDPDTREIVDVIQV